MHALPGQEKQCQQQQVVVAGSPSWQGEPAPGISSLFQLGKDPEIKGSSPFDSLLSFVSDPSSDHLAPKDQDSVAQPGSLPASMDATTCQISVSTQGPSTTVWLQQPEALQPALALPQGPNNLVQQSSDPSLWVLPAQGLQQQQAALDATSAQLQALQCSTAMVDVNGMPLLQGSNVVSLQQQQQQGASLVPVQQGINATINGVPVVLQVHSSPAAGHALQQQLPASSLGASLQPMPQPQQQQVYVAPAAQQQTLVVGNSQQVSLQQAQVTLQQVQQQQQVLTSSISTAGAGADPALHQQLQQLQEAVQQLSSQTAAVQRHLLASHASQPQASQAQPVVLDLEGSMRSSSSPTGTLSMSAHLAASTANSSSPAGSYSGGDSLSSNSWQCLDQLSTSTTSSASYGLQHRGRPGPSPMAAGGSSQGGSMLRIVSGPEMPQPGQQQQQPGLAGSGYSHQLSGSCSQAQVVTVSGPCAGTVVLGSNWAGQQPAGAGAGSNMPQPGPAAVGSMGGQHPMTGEVVFNSRPRQGPNQQAQQYQPGRINTAGAMGGYSHQQRPFRGNKPFGPPKGPRHQPPMRGGQPPKPAAAGGVGRVVEGTPLGSSSSPAAHPGPHCPAPWCYISLHDGLQQLWSAEALARSRGGRLYNVQQLAWHPVGEPDPCAQDMYNFQKLKRMVQKLDAVHKTRVKLIKRIHAVADHGDCDLKAVYREVRVLIGEMLHDSAMMIRSLEECRVTGLVRLALMLQEALTLGPKEAEPPAGQGAGQEAGAQRVVVQAAPPPVVQGVSILAAPAAW